MKKLIIIVSLIFPLIFPILFVNAEEYDTEAPVTSLGETGGAMTGNLGIFFSKSFYKNPVNPSQAIAMLILFLLSLIGLIFVLLMIYGGFRWLTAQGNQGQVDEARAVIINAVLGAIVVFSAYSIVSFFLKNLAVSLEEAPQYNRNGYW